MALLNLAAKFDNGGAPMVYYRLFACRNGSQIVRYAAVAELADALRSGRSGHRLVGVQVPPAAQKEGSYRGLLFFCLSVALSRDR